MYYLFNSLFDLENGYINEKNLLTLDNTNFNEIFDKNKLGYILNNLEDIECIYRSDAHNNVALDKYYKYSTIIKERKKKTETVAKQYGNLKVKYIQNDNGLYGRYQAKNAMSGQGMVREARHTIFKEYYVDLDIDNCHPVITKWLCDNLKIECPHLKDYIFDREKHFKNLIQLNPECDREHFKKVFLKLSYGCGDKSFNEMVKNKNDFINNFKKEIVNIQKLISEKFYKFHQINTKLRNEKNKKYNYEGSTLSHICQFVENQLLMHIIKYLQENKKLNIQDSILCFDGLMINKEKYNTVTGIGSEFIDELKKYFEGLNISLNFSIKNMDLDNAILKKCDYDFDYKYIYRPVQLEPVNEFVIFDKNNNSKFSDYIELQKNDINEEDMYKIREFVVNNIAFIVNGGNSYYITKNFKRIINSDYFDNDKVSYQMIYEHIDKKALDGIVFYINPFDNSDSSALKLTSFIRECLDIISYEYIDFIPFNSKNSFDYSNKDVFNTFTGFKHDYDADFIVDMDIIEILLFHIRVVVCNNDLILYEHFLTWIADIIQNPHILSEVRYILQSEEGAGKNILFYILMEHVMGSDLCLITDDIEKITGRFNGSMQGKLLVVLDEACNLNGSSESHKVEQKMKSITTNPKLVVEKKGKEVITINNFCRNVSLTNNDFAGKRGRRVNFVKMNNEYIGNTEYFNKLALLLNDDIGKHIFHYFSNFKISINIKKRHITNYELELGLAQADSVYRFLIDSINEPDLYALLDVEKEEQQFTVCYAFECFNEYCIINNIKNNKKKTYFSSFIIKVLNKKESDRWYIGDKNNKSRVRGYTFNLSELKNNLMLKLKNNKLFDN